MRTRVLYSVTLFFSITPRVPKAVNASIAVRVGPTPTLCRANAPNHAARTPSTRAKVEVSASSREKAVILCEKMLESYVEHNSSNASGTRRKPMSERNSGI